MESWMTVARQQVSETRVPFLPQLQIQCQQIGCAFPELDSFIRASEHAKPGFLLCGGEAALAGELATLLGHDALPPCEDSAFVQEFEDAASAWRFLWIRHPGHFHAPECRPSEIEVLLSQRAAVVVEGTLPLVQKTLEALGQKLWVISKDQLSIEHEHQRLLAEVGTLCDDRDEDLELRAGAAWTWVASRLLKEIELKIRSCRQIANQYEVKLNAASHLLGQYRTNWTGSIRSLVEATIQSRTSSRAFGTLFDPAKPGPEASSYLAAVGLPTLWTALDQFVADRLADLVAALAGLASRLELRQIHLGDAKTRWAVRSLNRKLEVFLNNSRIFPGGGGKRGGLVGNLTGRKQAVIDERKGQIMKASRLTVQFMEAEFDEWVAALLTTVQAGIATQLTAALGDQGFSDGSRLRSTIEELEQLAQMVQDRPEVTHDPQTTALQWLRLVASRRNIPLPQAR